MKLKTAYLCLLLLVPMVLSADELNNPPKYASCPGYSGGSSGVELLKKYDLCTLKYLWCRFQEKEGSCGGKLKKCIGCKEE